ncbi:MAG: 2-hydroxyglutaryl-CoA dehydratase [Breznakia sp.]
MRKEHVEFSRKMRKTHTILIPSMLHIHFEIIAEILIDEGYNVELLKANSPNIAHEGIQNVHNDTCYPALLVVGQMIDALKNGQYDLHKTALIMPQTGGGCRASNYINLLRKALKNNNMEYIPVISLNFAGLESNAGFKITTKMIVKIIYGIIYADLLMWISNQCLPYEQKKGTTTLLTKKWTRKIADRTHSPSFLRVKHTYQEILNDFSRIEKRYEQKIKVGIVGEIYMKYSSLGNNNLEQFLIREGAEPVVSGLLDFVAYCCENMIMDYNLYKINKKYKILGHIALRYITKNQEKMIATIKKHGVFTAMSNFNEVKNMANDYISKGVKMGEGWLLTSEMLELIHSGVNNIICTQPFGCLPNHIVAKGMMRKIKDNFPYSNVVAIDYDPGASTINQENRIKLMLSNAKFEMKE